MGADELPTGDRSRAVELLIAEREARVEAERRRAAELERKLEEQYQLVARYREALRPVLWIREKIRGEMIRSVYGKARRWAWRHPEFAKPAVAAKRLLRELTSDTDAHELARSRFDTDWYARRYADEVSGDPWQHYLERGWRAGAWPHPLFDVRHYLETNPEVAGAEVEPFGHYLASGWRQGRDPNPLFDVGWYLSRNPEVVDAGTEPLEHYSTGAWRESRDPGPLFSVRWYVDQHAQQLGDEEPLAHYLHHGIGLGWTTSASHAAALRVSAPAEVLEATPPRDAMLAAIAHPGAHDVVAFDVDAMFTLEHGAGAPARAARRVARVRHEAQPDAAVEARFRERWSRPRPDVSRAYHQLAAFGGQELALVGDVGEHVQTLGVDLGSCTMVPSPSELPAGDVVHVTVDPERSSAEHVVPVPYADPSADPMDRMRVALADLERLYLDGERNPHRRRVIAAATGSALLPATLVACAIDRAVEHGLDRVHYLSREGRFLADLHPRMAHRLHIDAPRAVHLEVSRRSTFGPSLSHFDRQALMDLWRMYSRQSVRALLTSLGVEPDDFLADAQRHGIGFDTTIEDIHTDEATLTFLTDPQVTDRLAAVNEQRRQALLAYLRRCTDPSLPRWLVVDVGWRGTIQDNLARLMPETHVDGLYLANFPFLNPQPPNTTKGAVAVDGNRGDDFAFMEPPAAVERPWTADVASVIDYRLGEDGRAVAVREKEHLAGTQSSLLALYQAVTGRAVEVIADHIAAGGLTRAELEPPARELLRRYYEEPFPGIADLWFGSEHDDTFGVLNVTPFGKHAPHVGWLTEGWGGLEARVEAGAAGSLWQEGYRAWLPVQAVTALSHLASSGTAAGPA